MAPRDRLQEESDRPALADRRDRTRLGAGGNFEARNRHAIGETEEAETVRPERWNVRLRTQALEPLLTLRAGRAPFEKAAGMDHERASAVRDRLLNGGQNFFIGEINGNHVSGLG